MTLTRDLIVVALSKPFASQVTNESDLPAVMREFLFADPNVPVLLNAICEADDHVYPMVREDDNGMRHQEVLVACSFCNNVCANRQIAPRVIVQVPAGHGLDQCITARPAKPADKPAVPVAAVPVSKPTLVG